VAKKSKSKEAAAASGPETAAPGLTTVALRILIDPVQDSRSLYVNYMELSQTPYDFTLMGVQAPSKLTPEQLKIASSGAPLSLEAEFQVTFPVSMLTGLIHALLTQKEIYEKTFKVDLGEVAKPTFQQG
jgi:hypothetical protein